MRKVRKPSKPTQEMHRRKHEEAFGFWLLADAACIQWCIDNGHANKIASECEPLIPPKLKAERDRRRGRLEDVEQAAMLAACAHRDQFGRFAWTHW